MFAVQQTIVVLLLSSCFAQQEGTSLLEQLPTTGVRGVSGICPSAEVIKTNITDELSSILNDVTIPALEARAVCPCGGRGKWRRIAQLDMRDPNQQCPPNWRLIDSPKRTCGRSTDALSCDSAVFPSNGVSYSRVCGRVIAYHRGTPSAFEPSFSGRGLEDVYLEGVSITRGPAGSRQHIWSFAEALYDNPQGIPDHICPCSISNQVWTRTVPAFIQNNYFCDSGNRGPAVILAQVYAGDPLWDGAGCSATSSCCEFNNPPWFCTTLDQATSEDIEVRICLDNPTSFEDLDVELVDIYTM